MCLLDKPPKYIKMEKLTTLILMVVPPSTDTNAHFQVATT